MMARLRIPGNKLGKLAFGLGGLAAIALILVFYAQRGSDAGASQAQDFGDAIAKLTNSGAETAATVNGVPISIGKVKAYLVFSSTGKKLGQVSFDKSVREYVDGLIESELLFQEAQRRGLVPSDAEVQAAATQTKTGLIEFMKQDTQEAKDLRNVFAQVKGTPYGIDAYDSGVMLDNFRHTMAIGKVRSAIGDELPTDARADKSKRDTRVQEVLAELRAKATIEVSPLP